MCSGPLVFGPSQCDPHGHQRHRNSDDLPPEVIADGFYAKGDHLKNLFGNSRAATS